MKKSYSLLGLLMSCLIVFSAARVEAQEKEDIYCKENTKYVDYCKYKAQEDYVKYDKDDNFKETFLKKELEKFEDQKDLKENDLQMNDLQMNDLQMNDLQMNDLQMNDLQMNDLQMLK